MGILPEIEDEFFDDFDGESSTGNTEGIESSDQNLNETDFTPASTIYTPQPLEVLSWIFSQEVPLLGFDWQISDSSGDLQVLSPLFYNRQCPLLEYKTNAEIWLEYEERRRRE